MSEERVTSRASEQKKNRSWSVDDEHIRKTSGYLRHSFVGRLLYRYMLFLMFVESIWWSFMDITRAHRMRVSERIIKHKHNDRA